ncbi:hypothetical protein [Cohnella kolymensis]|nr:hypothetical protein [Cohnella kolymensis]
MFQQNAAGLAEQCSRLAQQLIAQTKFRVISFASLPAGRGVFL